MAINIYSPRPSKVLFIDEDYIKNTTEVNLNVEPKIIRTSIQYMQDKYILPILGNNIFEKFKSDITSGVTYYSGNVFAYMNQYESMLFTDWVQPCLAAATMMELVYKINLQIKNKGVEQSFSENSTNATDSQIQWLSENYRETAAFYAQRCTQFLTANLDLFPNYLNPQIGTVGNGADLFYPNRTSYAGGGLFVPGLAGNSGGKYFGWGLSVEQRLQFLDLEGNLFF